MGGGLEVGLELCLKSWDRRHRIEKFRSQPHGARLVSVSGGLQPHVGSVKGVVGSLGH